MEKEGRVTYAALEEQPRLCSSNRDVRLRRTRRAAKLWIAEGAERHEKLTLASLLEEGETL